MKLFASFSVILFYCLRFCGAVPQLEPKPGMLPLSIMPKDPLCGDPANLLVTCIFLNMIHAFVAILCSLYGTGVDLLTIASCAAAYFEPAFGSLVFKTISDLATAMKVNQRPCVLVKPWIEKVNGMCPPATMIIDSQLSKISSFIHLFERFHRNLFDCFLDERVPDSFFPVSLKNSSLTGSPPNDNDCVNLKYALWFCPLLKIFVEIEKIVKKLDMKATCLATLFACLADLLARLAQIPGAEMFSSIANSFAVGGEANMDLFSDVYEMKNENYTALCAGRPGFPFNSALSGITGLG